MSRLVIAFSLIACGIACAADAPAEWPTFHGPDRTNKSPDKGLLKEWPAAGPKLLWSVNMVGQGFSSPSIAGGTVYITGDTGDACTLYAFDMDGKLKWKGDAGKSWPGGPGGTRGTPTIDGNNVYLLNGHGALMCFDAATGKGKWQRMAKEFGGSAGGWGYAETPLVYKDNLIFKPGGRNCIVALNKNTGEPVWRSAGFVGGPEYSSLLPFDFNGQTFLATGTNAGIVCVNAKDGAVAFSNGFCARNVANCPTPAFADGYLFWSNGYGKGCICFKLIASGGADVAWQGQQMVNHHGGYIIDNGCIYGHSDSGGWVCLDLKTGAKKWSDNLVGKGSVTYADGMLYLFGEGGGKVALIACAPEKPQVKGQFSVKGNGPSWAHPVIIGGRLYLRYDKNLYCYDVKG